MKKMTISLAILVLLSFQVFAVSTLTTGLRAYWKGDTSEFISEVNPNGANFTGKPVNVLFNASSGISNGAYYWNGVSASSYMDTQMAIDANFTSSGFAAALWLKRQANLSEAKLFGAFSTNAIQAHIDTDNANFENEWWTYNGAVQYGYDVHLGCGLRYFNTWYHQVFMWNGTHYMIYTNGTLCEPPHPDTSFTPPTTFNLYLGARHTAGGADGAFNGTLDEIGIWNRALTPAEITQLYNGGAPGVNSIYPFESSSYIAAFVNPTPADKARINININTTPQKINISCSSYPAAFNIYFGASNITMHRVFSNTLSVPANWTINATADGSYFYTADCGGSNLSIRSYVIDTAKPTLTFNPSNTISPTNTTYMKIGTPFTLNVTAQDANYLFAFEYSLTQPNGSLIRNASAYPINVTSYTYDNTTNMSFGYGNFTITLGASDTHTLSDIGAYQSIITSNKIQYNTAEKNEVSIYTSENSIASTIKESDRYIFSFEFGEKATIRTYYLSSKKPIIYLRYSKYPAHFIISDGIRGNWIDFYSDNLDKAIVTKITDFLYKIDVSYKFLASKESFNSIGGLNIEAIKIAFEVKAPPDILAVTPNTYAHNMSALSTSAFSISVNDSHSSNLSYTWLFDSVNVSGDNHHSYTASVLDAAQIHNLTVYVRDAFNQEDYNYWAINVTYSPIIEDTLSGTYLGIIIFFILFVFVVFFLLAYLTRMPLFYFLAAFYAFTAGIILYSILPSTTQMNMWISIFMAAEGLGLLAYVFIPK